MAHSTPEEGASVILQAGVRGGRTGALVLLSAFSVLALLVSLALALPAAAHSRLLTSDPFAGAILESPPRQVVLSFSEEIEPSFAHMTLTAGGGRPSVLNPKVQGRQVTAVVAAPNSKATGRWSVGYRVVSADGHPITGVVTFTVRPSTQPTPEPSSVTAGSGPSQPSATAVSATTATPATTSATAKAPENQPDRAGRVSPTTWILAGSAVLIGALGAAAWRVRRKST